MDFATLPCIRVRLYIPAKQTCSIKNEYNEEKNAYSDLLDKFPQLMIYKDVAKSGQIYCVMDVASPYRESDAALLCNGTREGGLRYFLLRIFFWLVKVIFKAFLLSNA